MTVEKHRYRQRGKDDECVNCYINVISCDNS